MLRCLHVRNMALIDEVTLELHHNLNIFSGETGAGKSMLIDSIQFAIGNRTSRQMIRKNQNCAYVSLLFEDTKGEGIAYIEENGFPYEDRMILLERSLYQTGRTVYKINGVTCTRQIIKELAAKLIDVHGQHEPQSLLEVTKHIDMLDSFGDETFIKEKRNYKKQYEEWLRLKQERDTKEIDERKKLQLKDMLSFQINEIESCKLKKGEEESLKSQYDVLAHAEKILQACQKAYDSLESGGRITTGANELVGCATQAIQDIAHIHTTLDKLASQLMAVEAELQDAAYQIRKYADDIEYSPELLENIQKRLDTIYRLKQKYGSSIEDILEYKIKCEKELQELEDQDKNQEKLEEDIRKIEATLSQLAAAMTAKRQAIATNIEEHINKHLKDLQMPHAHFKVAIETTALHKKGEDNVEFLIRTNLGDDMHGLAKIASGGEISRVMLAIKTVMVLGDTIETVIFDEIDTGISGLAAQKVAEKLGMISRSRQVICITHLPQIAAMGDQNYLIEKKTEEDTTTTHLNELNELGKREELCRLMGGMVTESTLEGARELQAFANTYKTSIC